MNEPSQAEPTKPTVVGIGASAGGLAALRTFFESVPEQSGLTFVVVVHLSPERESLLPDLLQSQVKMPVRQVTETVPMVPDRVYVIPPNANLEAIDTHLRLSKLEERRQERAPIDHFFRTLARTHDGHAIGVILTGTGTDGALGIKEIKEKNGLTIVQDPNEAEYDGMPQSAIATGFVDLILPLREIPAAILRLTSTTPRIPVPDDPEQTPPEIKQLLHKVYGQVRSRTGRDFSHYKRTTILRRIARRMQLRQVEELAAYHELLRRDPDEVRSLADDLLITVTSFFRDREVFDRLEQEVVPMLFADQGAEDQLRAWSVGCATGEEAYSLAILLAEEAARREVVPHLQIFASDLHEQSLVRARDGFYATEIEADVSIGRLKRFFQHEAGGYRVRKELREMVVFAPHNLLGDPPFSRIDLLVCRNLLIYLERDVQRDVIELFHYALRANGILIVGTSETIDSSELFLTVDKRAGIYRKRNVAARDLRLPVFPQARIRFGDEVTTPADPATGRSIPYGPFHQRLLERCAPPSMLIGPDDRVLHLSENAGQYCLLSGGELSTSVFKIVKEELRVELRSLLHTARQSGKPARSPAIPVRFDGEVTPVVMDVRPAREAEDKGFLLVLFDERPDLAVSADEAAAAKPAHMLAAQTEIEQLRQHLQSVIEEYETSQEEMRATNEELQSTNEEIRSTMEELETSKEELQSMNEELQTVNQENRHKVEELAQLSGDLQNLLAATDIATLFLDRELRILRFTPKLGQLFNVRMTDRGRPISDLTHRLGDNRILEDVDAVLHRLIPVEREVRDGEGRWYLTRVLPYRSREDHHAGVVITLFDITERKCNETALAESEARTAAELAAMQRLHALVTRLLSAPSLATALEQVLEAAMAITDADMGIVQLWNEARRALEIIVHRGYQPEFLAHAAKVAATDDSAPARAAREKRQIVVEDLTKDRAYAGYLVPAGTSSIRAVQSTPLVNLDGQIVGVLSTHHEESRSPSQRDLRILELYARQAADYITHVRSKEALLEKSRALQREDEKKDQFLAMLGHELRNPLAALDSAMTVADRSLQDPAEVHSRMGAHIAQLKSLVDDLLDISRITQGKIVLKPARCNFTEIVHRSVEAVLQTMRSKGQQLGLALADNLWLTADACRLEQIVSNLLANAVAYTGDHGKVEITLARRNDDAVLEVKDNGRGLRPEQQAVIFDVFMQCGSANGGLGIGLWLAKRLTELHGGSIQAASGGPGRGCTFTVSIPVGKATATVEPTAPKSVAATPLPKSVRILVVDDVHDNAEMLALILRSRGAQTACAFSGTEAIERAAEWKPAVMLIDIGLPDLNGKEVAERVRARTGGECPVLIAVTGFGDEGHAEAIRAAGFDEKLIKPVPEALLLERIRHHLAAKAR